MDERPRGVICDRARAWAALAPDGELSEIERKLLDAHLARCQSCEAFTADVAVVAEALHRERLTPLSHPIAIPSWRRRTGYGGIRAVGAAAAVALMAIGIAARAPLPVNETVEFRRITNFSNDAEGEVAQILRAQGGAAAAIARLRPGRQGVGQPL